MSGIRITNAERHIALPGRPATSHVTSGATLLIQLFNTSIDE